LYLAVSYLYLRRDLQPLKQTKSRLSFKDRATNTAKTHGICSLEFFWLFSLAILAVSVHWIFSERYFVMGALGIFFGVGLGIAWGYPLYLRLRFVSGASPEATSFKAAR
jgi:hypothetical protein